LFAFWDMRREAGKGFHLEGLTQLMDKLLTCPRCIARVRQGEISSAERVEHPKYGERRSDAVAALDADETRELSLLVAVLDAIS
jgi:hypothetical protein